MYCAWIFARFRYGVMVVADKATGNSPVSRILFKISRSNSHIFFLLRLAVLHTRLNWHQWPIENPWPWMSDLIIIAHYSMHHSTYMSEPQTSIALNTVIFSSDLSIQTHENSNTYTENFPSVKGVQITFTNWMQHMIRWYSLRCHWFVRKKSWKTQDWYQMW